MMDPNKPLAPGARPDVRLAKRVAELVPCSRREAEQYIEGGWVRVDGKVVEEPQFRVLKQRIELDKNASLMTLPEGGLSSRQQYCNGAALAHTSVKNVSSQPK